MKNKIKIILNILASINFILAILSSLGFIFHDYIFIAGLYALLHLIYTIITQAGK